MTTPRDWLPPYPARDPRNQQHYNDYYDYAKLHPESSAMQRQRHADEKLRTREEKMVKIPITLEEAIKGTMVERGGGWIKIHKLTPASSDLVYELLTRLSQGKVA